MLKCSLLMGLENIRGRLFDLKQHWGSAALLVKSRNLALITHCFLTWIFHKAVSFVISIFGNYWTFFGKYTTTWVRQKFSLVVKNYLQTSVDKRDILCLWFLKYPLNRYHSKIFERELIINIVKRFLLNFCETSFRVLWIGNLGIIYKLVSLLNSLQMKEPAKCSYENMKKFIWIRLAMLLKTSILETRKDFRLFSITKEITLSYKLKEKTSHCSEESGSFRLNEEV